MSHLSRETSNDLSLEKSLFNQTVGNEDFAPLFKMFQFSQNILELKNCLRLHPSNGERRHFGTAPSINYLSLQERRELKTET